MPPQNSISLCVAALLVIGCSSSKEPTPTPERAARPTVTDPVGFCARARAVLLRRKKCFAEDESLAMALRELDTLEQSAPAEPEARRQVAAKCAVTLDGLMRVQQPHDCPLDVLESERQELATFLAGWYGERTAAPATGNAELDAEVGKLAAQRDAACACPDLACLRAATEGLDPGLDAQLAAAPEHARHVVAKIVDEVARCKQKLALGR